MKRLLAVLLLCLLPALAWATSITTTGAGSAGIADICGTPGNDSYAKLMLHLDGTDASTTFTDSSASAHTVTAYGNVQIDTAQSKFGGASGLFDGSGDYLGVPDAASLTIGANDFTIDLWVRFNSIPAHILTLVRKGRIIDSNQEWTFEFDGSANNLNFQISTNGTSVSVAQSSSWTPSTSTWYHVAIIRTGGSTLRMFVNGTQIGSDATSSSTYYDGNGALTIGATWSSGGNAFNGWLDELRFSNGVARWTANFTPPTSCYSPYTN